LGSFGRMGIGRRVRDSHLWRGFGAGYDRRGASDTIEVFGFCPPDLRKIQLSRTLNGIKVQTHR
jgi:hypothetical protein